MKRLFFWILIFLGAFILFFFSLNLFDSRPEPGLATPISPGGEKPAEREKLLAALLESGNGFFLIWGFAEPAETDLQTPVFRAQVLELINAPSKNYLFRSRYSQWLTRLNTSYRQNWQGANFYFPQLQDEDICTYFGSRRGQIAERLERFALPLQRYRQVLLAADLEDFTPLGWEFPTRSILLATYMARLFAASRVQAALDGDWRQAGDDLLDAAAAGFKLIGCGRTMAVNSLGKTMVELSLRSLASLFNRSDFPPETMRLILERLPGRPIGEFGTTAVRTSAWMGFALALERVKKDRVVDPFLLKDYFHNPADFYVLERFVAISGPRLFAAVHALTAFFLKKNESTAALRAFWEGVGRLEETPPFLWRSGSRPSFRLGTTMDLGPLWWLRNPLGKMMVRSAVPFTWPVLQHYIYRSQGLKVRYDLTRLLARARLLAGRNTGLDQTGLERMLASAFERDPFSGSPFLFSRELGMLYSVGPDRVDNGGREQPALMRDSDIAVPIRFVQ
jgi:hypothetical protein